MEWYLSQLSQLWPPAPTFTEKDLSSQAGKTIIITGASSGSGKELARLLYSLDAKVYIAGRSQERVSAAIEEIKKLAPDSKGELIFLPCDLEDLASVRDAAKQFLVQEKQLDVLVHNAGVMLPPTGSKTKQGYELQMGVHTLAPLLLTKLLTPVMAETANRRPTGTVRVVWVVSSAAELASPKGGIEMDNLDYSKHDPGAGKYGTSKAGMYLLSQKYAQLHADDGIIDIACNPGNFKTNLRRHLSWWLAMIFGWMSWPAVNAAYTELYCAFSDDLADKSGQWVIPWGRIGKIREDLVKSTLAKNEGGKGLGDQFHVWCEDQIREFET